MKTTSPSLTPRVRSQYAPRTLALTSSDVASQLVRSWHSYLMTTPCVGPRKRETEHLRSYVSRYSDFQDTHRQWINSDTIEQFEATWEDMHIKYELERNCWLSDMYIQHIHWAKPFLKDTFFASMTTTGRSASINSFFDGFVNSKTMLNEFVVQYDKAVESRRAAEEDEDFKTMNSRPLSIRDPLGATTTKGRPKLESRIKSSLEAPKKQTCSYCQGLGHYATSCSKRKADESLQEIYQAGAFPRSSLVPETDNTNTVSTKLRPLAEWLRTIFMLLAESVLRTRRVHAMHQLKLASEVRFAPTTHRYGPPKLIHHVKSQSWLPCNTYKALFEEMTSKMATLVSNPNGRT
uniref:Protein FAR1-RELATED SEQUENCE n=1 Tax=Lactuca sativa TaxID=4236 RepID=A0A9R1XM01_LACSA|nr:hypothetical protein LSAT_V11C300149240 [Lactuca sativa]